MIPMTVSEIRKLDKDAKIPLFTGKVVELKKTEYKSYNGKNWTEQTLKVEDSEGKKIKVVLNGSSLGLEAQDVVYTFSECVHNSYSAKIEGKDVICHYLKCWGKAEPLPVGEKPVETHPSPIPSHSDKPTEPIKTPYYNTNESIARMNALGHAVEMYKSRGIPFELGTVIQTAQAITKWILTNETEQFNIVDPDPKTTLDETEIPF